MTTTVNASFRFHAPAGRLFEVLFGDVREIQRYTRAPAISDARAGGVYSLYEGAVSGVFKEVSVPRTVLTWRLRNWAPEAASEACVTIVAKGSLVASVTPLLPPLPRSLCPTRLAESLCAAAQTRRPAAHLGFPSPPRSPVHAQATPPAW